MKHKHLFGPVPSRRLGVSLGIDLIPYKTCTFNCVFCECGGTTQLTLERKAYVPTDEVLSELDDYLSRSPALDYITFAGSGEPTLHTGIGTLIDRIKARHPEYRIAILTNGSLFSLESLRSEVSDADLIIPTLAAVSQEVFKRIHRPHPALDPARHISGLAELRRTFPGEIWLEVFVIPGLNTKDSELEGLREAITRIGPDRVQLNTLDRPGAVDWVTPASQEELERIAVFLDGTQVEVVGSNRSRKSIQGLSGDIPDAIMATLGRRPCTIADLSSMLGLHANEVNKYISILLDENKIVERCGGRRKFYLIGEMEGD